jgi:hypothetical protein
MLFSAADQTPSENTGKMSPRSLQQRTVVITGNAASRHSGAGPELRRARLPRRCWPFYQRCRAGRCGKAIEPGVSVSLHD